MAFHLTRYVNDSSVRNVEPGGTFTLGSTNSTLYTGEIDYTNIPSGAIGYWTIPLNTISVQSTPIALSGSASYAAIDTGTTLLGGPSDVVAQIYSKIPGSAPGSGNYEGYYTYPCSTDVSVSLTFGTSNQSWPISPADFRLVAISDDTCVGALFTLQSSGSGSTPSWIIGDTFLKNVYSVFRASPASVGFAQLSEVALGMNGANSPVPTPTLGTPAATVTSTSTSGSSRCLPGSIAISVILSMVTIVGSICAT
ncbi:hypothetical protein EW026_g5243 [Hermanssonia centrifuga]|uniref:Peptidase A1 domain-containing protein n=1 Tax=Hermanssonia centrifuga TaxID=98765 RepID=A0A4S4KEQ2_9APHY|nr:hypothetical protein EW026_g5243 [Hermanssonia centrifuga]